jgi:magnesium transporter
MEEDKEDIKFLGIVYDSINQLIDMVESYRETINSTRDIFSSSISLQTNETMKILTIFSTIILPLSLLLSVFSLQGFDLNNITMVPKDFVILVGVMVTIIGITLLFFWRKQWILSRDTKNHHNNNSSRNERKNNNKR